MNDLEWLAVNYNSNAAKSNGYTSALRLGDNYIAQPDGTVGSHGIESIIVMRYHLGLDKKPHYEFISGQWSETK